MKILVSNVGSTSLKFKLFEMAEDEKLLCEAKIERVGSLNDAIFSYTNYLSREDFKRDALCLAHYADGIHLFLNTMTDLRLGVGTAVDDICAVGFKTVLAKGYCGVFELNEEVLDAMREYLFVAPAHNAPYLEAIAEFRRIMPQAVPVGVFETAFHSTIPLERRLYSIPYEWYEKYGIMRMGYHGASHSYIAETAKVSRLISCHLGGSCSVCAILDGKSVDNTFGFSLQTGIPHANRVGDIDPFIIPFLLDHGMSMDEILNSLAKNGGLLGVSGVSNDLRQIEAAAANGNERAALALDMFSVSVVRAVGAYYAELGGLDKLVFTGGIGENSAAVRAKICASLSHMGIILDKAKNSACDGAGIISAEKSPVLIEVIPANEELGVARKTREYIMRMT